MLHRLINSHANLESQQIIVLTIIATRGGKVS
jgi:hypothetical protein